MKSLSILVCIFGIFCFVAVCYAENQNAINGKCKGRCGEGYNRTFPCQCNTKCVKFGDCCDDFTKTCSYLCSKNCAKLYSDINSCQNCSYHNVPCVSNDEIYDFTSELWALDVDRASLCDFKLNIQNLTTEKGLEDKAELTLFSGSNEHILQRESFKVLEKLFNNYEKEQGLPEGKTFAKNMDEVDFVDYFVRTKIGTALYGFLKKHGLSGCGSKEDFKKILGTIWFENFSRKALQIDSSGFEHVFVGETRVSKTHGFHNWVQFYREEKAGNINYLGYLNLEDDDAPKNFFNVRNPNIHFLWHGKIKEISSFMLGVTPEWEFAVYSLCFFTRQDSRCPVMTTTLDGEEQKATIQTYSWKKTFPPNGLKYVSTAYFV